MNITKITKPNLTDPDIATLKELAEDITSEAEAAALLSEATNNYGTPKVREHANKIKDHFQRLIEYRTAIEKGHPREYDLSRLADISVRTILDSWELLSETLPFLAKDAATLNKEQEKEIQTDFFLQIPTTVEATQRPALFNPDTTPGEEPANQ